MSSALPLRKPEAQASALPCAGFALAGGGILHCFKSDRPLDAGQPPLLDGSPARYWRLRNHLDVAARAAGLPCWVVLLETGEAATLLRLTARDESVTDIASSEALPLAELGRHIPIAWLPLVTRFLPAEQALADLLRGETPPRWHRLHDPEPGQPEEMPLPVTRLMTALRHLRPDVTARHPTASDFLAWCLLDGSRDYPALRESPDWHGSALRRAVHAARHDLQAAFADPDGAEFEIWCRDHGADEVPALAAPAVRRAPVRLQKGGVTQIGHARGALGIGEDCRMAARALQTAGVPVAVLDVPVPGDAADDRLADLLSDAPPYAATLLCLTGFASLELFAREGSGFWEGRRIIGLWPWELPRWPARFATAADLVEELWAASAFTADSYNDALVPVRHLPPAVSVSPPNLSRADFGLPEDTFLFHAGFDGNSTLARKNPLGAIDAFRAAFPRIRRDVGLVVKAMNLPRGGALRGAIAGDPRIRLIEDRLPRAHAEALLACCDAHFALHRAEGFGRIPAEALALGLPVIATGWSGTADYLTAETGFPVDYTLIPLPPGAYPFAEGQHWAEPDIGHAARLLQQVADDPVTARAVATRGQARVRREYSPEAAGRRYRARLEALGWL
ncbi:MAG: glycosyltransferase [Oceanibaculum nanhaiense]|uniref:glycosyltransferase n=1 Tax=Oceanibaculum nanhaiense TaxID=1909734 RepID=UPI0025A3B8A9|nr:glycosyltransferase [Oceanibaculum nanhaiense]MDM7945049.1 glycosyltransferase [Oceanibaculum nanhaiense]